MMKSGWTERTRRVALCGVLGLGVLAAFTPTGARAQEEDTNKSSSIIDGVMRGLGLRNGGESQIEYRERSPLVVPPSRTLPPPESATAGRTAAWPVDPDVKRRQDAAAKRKANNNRGYDPDHEGRNLSPSELNPPGATGSTRRTTTATPGNMGEEGKPMRPSELGYLGNLFSSFGGGQKEEVGTFTNEPPRGSLTAPPTGYQTPSPAQPYGLSNKKERLTVTPDDRAVGQ